MTTRADTIQALAELLDEQLLCAGASMPRREVVDRGDWQGVHDAVAASRALATAIRLLAADGDLAQEES